MMEDDGRPCFALLVDVETGSATDDPNGALSDTDSRIVEIAWARVNLETGNALSCESYVVCDGAATIPDVVSTTLGDIAAVRSLPSGQGIVWHPLAALSQAARDCDVLIAHNAEFDRARIAEYAERCRPDYHAHRMLDDGPWVCSYRDIEWPRGNRSLNETALSHGVGVARAHGALDDVLTLAALFRAVIGMGVDARQLVADAMLPRVEVRALVSYDDRDLAKADGFRWDGERKWWLKSVRSDRLSETVAACEARGYQTQVLS